MLIINSIKQLFLTINCITKYRLDKQLSKYHKIFLLCNIIRWTCPWYLFYSSRNNFGTNLRLALEELGPIYIKLGQFLSTRIDLLPPDVIVELTKLQDKTPAFCGKLALKILEQSLAAPIDNYFKDVNPTPLASASIAQVHSAVLLDGSPVIVKILRPKIKQQIYRDIKNILMIVEIIQLFSKRFLKLNIARAIIELNNILKQELDLLQEAANCSQFKRNMLNNASLYVPKIYWHLCRHNILVMEEVSNYIKITAAHANFSKAELKHLIKEGVAIFFEQLIKHGFFHADPHPGNIFISKTTPPHFIAIDFGIMSTLGNKELHYLTENCLALLKKDYRKMASLHIESNWVPKTTRVDEFESAIRGICEPLFGRELSQISFGATLARLLQTAQRFNMEILPQLLLLQKTLINVEGIARQLAPELNLWQEVLPHFENWLKEQIATRTIFGNLKRNIPQLLEKFPEVASLVYKQLLQKNITTPPEVLAKNHLISKSKGNIWLLICTLIIIFPTALTYEVFINFCRQNSQIMLQLGSLGIIIYSLRGIFLKNEN